MPNLKFGVLLWNQATTWPDYIAAAKRLDELGYAHLWAWDHLYSIFGDSYQPIYEGWMSLAGAAPETKRLRLGLLVGANTFRNPGLVAKHAATLDHISNGRAILGVGGAWFELEHKAHGIEFGHSAGERLTWLDESVGAMRRLLDGESVTSDGNGHYHFDDLRHKPLPVQKHLPIMIGGGGEKKTLRTVAKYADMWNGMGKLEDIKRKVDVLHEHCSDVGRDPSQIEMTLGIKATIRDSEAEAVKVWKTALEHNRTPDSRVAGDATFWNGSAEQLAERLAPYVELGFHTVISEQPAPYDTETLERLIGEVGPLAERGVAAPAR
jgi:alkanesulfonate monooxygenase SsuD/methylene tetrahydromethanopterin reductase-like flavin-dependent oxidoreductase (luciferase family)